MKNNFHSIFFFLAVFGVFFFSFKFVPVQAEEIKIFLMADGRYYHPASGLYGTTREMLLEQLDFASSATSSEPLTATTTVHDVENPSATTTSVVTETTRLLLAVERAKNQLRETIEQDRAKGLLRTVADTDAGWRDVTLAVWNRTDETIVPVLIQKKGGRIRCSADDAEWCKKIRVAVASGLDSEYRSKQADEIVVALRYPAYERVSQKKKNGFRVQDVVYTPFAQGMKTSELIQIGKAHLQKTIQTAVNELRVRQAQSRGKQRTLLADAVDPRTMQTIAVIEHISHAETSKDATTTTDLFYATIALNADDAYAWERSPVGARGLLQFMPATYKILAKREDLGLIKDHEKGSQNPVNAFKAQAALIDVILAQVEDEVDAAATTDTRRIQEFLAAGYNTGSARVAKSIGSWDAQVAGKTVAVRATLSAEEARVWNALVKAKKKYLAAVESKKAVTLKKMYLDLKKEHQMLEAKLAGIPKSYLGKETRDYVKKFRLVYPITVMDPLAATTASVALAMNEVQGIGP